jgi:hypothetical protein
MPDTTKLPVMLELPPTARVVLILAKPVVVTPVEFAMKAVPTVCDAELTLVLTLAKPVDVMPVELAMKLEPTVCEAALTVPV